MTITATKMETATPFDTAKIALIGVEKSGKSRLAATGRKPVLVLDYDERKEAIAGLKDVYTLTFHDELWPKQPTVYNETLDLITKLEAGATLMQLSAIAEWPATKPRTLVFDSVASLAKAAMRFALYSNKDLRRSINVGGKLEVHLPYSFDGWNAEMSLVESIVLRALGIPNLDVIVILHEVAEEAPDSTAEKPKFTGRFGIFPVRYKLLLKYFNEVWRLTRDNGVLPQIQVVPNWQFTAATNLDLTSVNKPDIEYLINQALSKTK